MYKILLLCSALMALMVITLAAPVDQEATITHFVSRSDVGGNYAFEVGQSDGTSFGETGVAGKEVQGSYTYTSPEGQQIIVTYVADEFGFHPSSDVLPTPPPIPEAILDSIRFIEEHPTPEEAADRVVRAQQLEQERQLEAARQQ